MPPTVRHDWTREEVADLWSRPLLDLVFDAAAIHREHQPAGAVQWASLLSVKTGGCPEDCGYCPQSAHYRTDAGRQDLLPLDAVKEAARRAREQGATRFCMGGAWRSLPDGAPFDRLLEMVRCVRDLGLEACLTAGMVRPDQVERLAEAGLTAYNHNLDTGEGFYDQVITTRTYQDRLETLEHVRAAGLQVCCGGILGLGEKDGDRIDLLHRLATFVPHPESVPVNLLVPVEGTPLASRPPVDPLLLVRTIAVARILMPTSRIRLSAGRRDLTDEAHALCFLAGANSVFAGDRLLTTPNVESDRDEDLLRRLGLKKMETEAAAAPHLPRPAPEAFASRPT